MLIVHLALIFDCLKSLDKLDLTKPIELEIFSMHPLICYMLFMILSIKKIAPTSIKIHSSRDLTLLPQCLFFISKLKGLDLQLANLKHQTIKELLEIVLISQLELKTLRLKSNPDSPLDTIFLNPFLQKTQIENLSLGQVTFNGFLPDLAHLQSLELSHLSPENAMRLGMMPRLKKLTLTDSVLAENCFYRLQLPNLVALNLSRSQLLLEHFGIGFLSLLCAANVKYLNLHGAQIHPFCGLLLAKFLKQDKNLEVLSLAKVNFTAAVWREIFFNLSFHPRLQDFDVSDAALGSKLESFIAIRYFTKENHYIQYLNLSDNQFPSEFALLLLEHLIKFTKLVTLQFSNQFFADATLNRATRDALLSHQSLERLDLSYHGQLPSRIEQQIQAILVYNQSLHHVVGLRNLDLISRNVYFHQVIKTKIDSSLLNHDFKTLIATYDELKVFIAYHRLETGLMPDYLRQFYLDILLNLCHFENPQFFLALIESHPVAPELIELMVLNLFAQSSLDKSYLYPFLYQTILQLPDEQINLRQLWLIAQYLEGKPRLGFEENPRSIQDYRQNPLAVDYPQAKQALVEALCGLNPKYEEQVKRQPRPQLFQMGFAKIPSEKALYQAQVCIGMILLLLISSLGFYCIDLIAVKQNQDITPSHIDGRLR